MLYKRKTALVLGGGAARGFAHLGVLKIFEKNNFSPDLIVGTSMGAIIGAAYASGKYNNTAELIFKIKEILNSDEFEELGLNLLEKSERKKITFIDKLKNTYFKFNFYRKILNNTHIFENKIFNRILKKLIPDINIEKTKIPFAAVALNFKTGKEVILTDGSLIKAVMASSAIPGIFKPINYNRMLLIDGGWANKVPASAARKLKAKYVIASDVSREIKLTNIKNKNGLELLLTADDITSNILTDLQLLSADLVIHPLFKDADWYDVSKIDKFISLGETETIKNLLKLKYYFKYTPILTNLKNKFRRLIK